MPFVRIFHPSGFDTDLSAALSQGVHRALIDTFGISADDFFQVVTEHSAGTELMTPSEFLGITHSEHVVIVQITCAEGRTTEQKKALYEAIAENIGADTAISKADVIISLVETPLENWSFGNGIAPFA